MNKESTETLDSELTPEFAMARTREAQAILWQVILRMLNGNGAERNGNHDPQTKAHLRQLLERMTELRVYLSEACTIIEGLIDDNPTEHTYWKHHGELFLAGLK